MRMRADGLLIGAMSGGDTLPGLRGAMRAADAVAGAAAPHVHPRIEAAALAPLLTAAGFADPVVDIDRVRRCPIARLDALVGDLRAHGRHQHPHAQRPRFAIGKAALDAAAEHFARAGEGERTMETFEILHLPPGRKRTDAPSVNL